MIGKITWTDVKHCLEKLDKKELVDLIHQLYSAKLVNQQFLQTYFELGEDLLKPYKDIIHRCLYPDWKKNKRYSMATALKAISDYKKANGTLLGVVELSVFICETSHSFGRDFGFGDDSMLEQFNRAVDRAYCVVDQLEPSIQESFLDRLEPILAYWE